MKRRRAGAVGTLVLLGVLTSPTSSAGAGGPQVVWVSVENADRTVKVDVGAREVLRRFRTSGGPHNITVAQDGTVGVALYGAHHIAIIRGGSVDRVFLGGRPHDVKIADRRVVVANEGSSRIQLVRFDGRLMRRILLRHPPHDVAVAPNERRAWVTMNGTGNLAVVNLVRRAPVRYIRTGQRPHDILFGPDRNLWVTDWEGELHVFAVPRGRLLDTIQIGIESHHLAFTRDGRFAWITDHSARKVFIVRVRTVHVVDRIRFPGEPHHVAITESGRWAVVADHANRRIVVYNANTYRRVGPIHVGAGPHGVWASS